MLLCWSRDRDTYIFAEDSEEGEERNEEQDYPKQDVASEYETSDTAASESSGTNIFSDWKADEKIRNNQRRLIYSSFLQKTAKKVQN